MELQRIIRENETAIRGLLGNKTFEQFEQDAEKTVPPPYVLDIFVRLAVQMLIKSVRL
jgi:hypothetical protein